MGNPYLGDNHILMISQGVAFNVFDTWYFLGIGIVAQKDLRIAIPRLDLNAKGELKFFESQLLLFDQLEGFKGEVLGERREEDLLTGDDMSEVFDNGIGSPSGDGIARESHPCKGIFEKIGIYEHFVERGFHDGLY